LEIHFSDFDCKSYPTKLHTKLDIYVFIPSLDLKIDAFRFLKLFC